MVKERIWMQVVEPKMLQPVVRNTSKGQRNYIDKMAERYGDKCKVEQYKFDSLANIIIECVWTVEC